VPVYEPTEENEADAMTKHQPEKLFTKHANRLKNGDLTCRREDVKMDRFVTRAEAFLIPKIEENEALVTYESRMAVGDDEECQCPMRKRRTMSHSPGTTGGEFVSLRPSAE
jgi:hypothetical protein